MSSGSGGIISITQVPCLCRSASQLGIGEGALEATTLEEVFMQFHGDSRFLSAQNLRDE